MFLYFQNNFGYIIIAIGLASLVLWALVFLTNTLTDIRRPNLNKNKHMHTYSNVEDLR